MFIVPMGAAIWSVPTGSILNFPALSYLKFFENHGLLDLLTTQIQWRTVDGGSKQYVDKIIERLGKRVFLNTPVKTITRKNKKCYLHAGNGFGTKVFDQVVLAGCVLFKVDRLARSRKDTCWRLTQPACS